MAMASSTVAARNRQPYGPFTLLVLLAEALVEAKAVAKAALRRYPFVY